MSRLRALVVEDELPARRYLVELLTDTGHVAPVAAVGAVAAADLAMLNLEIDAAFIDIRLIDRPGDRSGLDWALGLAALADPPLLVFATASPEHALAAFDAGAADYLLKPFTRERVATCVDRLLARRATRAPRPPATRLLARTATDLVFLSLEGVLAFEAAERLTYVHHLEGRFLVDLSLAALEADFAVKLVRTHRNWLVALDHVRQLGRGEATLMVGASLTVPVSRERAASVREALLSRAVGIRR
jgi:DNA-binding LytR/AlgR family response regulator